MPSRAQTGAEAPLSRYIAKRNFEGGTSEPKGRVVRRRAQEPLSFVIQKHWASHLHYDFRLELDGVLLSWAVPKGPSLDPRQRRMAVHVEDHPVDYGSFEGTIPPKQYGAGEVIIWDNGTWEPVGDPKAGLRDGKFVFRLHGQKLAGLWQLVRTSKGDAKREQWLLIKKHDAWERPHDEYDVTMELPDSVVAKPLGPVEDRESREATDTAGLDEGASTAAAMKGGQASGTRQQRGGAGKTSQARKSTGGRRATSAAELSGQGADPAAKPAVKPAAKPVTEPATRSAAKTAAEDTSGPDLSQARKARQPATMTPQLATLVSSTPPGEWISEAKLDGYRLMTRITKGRVQLITRGGHDWTDRMPTLAQALADLKLDSAWLDGEVVVLGPEGAPVFNLLQNAIGRSGQSRQSRQSGGSGRSVQAERAGRSGSAASAGAASRGVPGEQDIVYFLFDVPYLQGHDLREVPLRERRRLLETLLADQPDDHLRFSAALDAPPDEMLAAACQMRLEGLILKRPDAPYVSTRSDSWVKLKCQLRQEFVVVGFTPRSDAPKGLGSLLLAVRDEKPSGGASKGEGGWRYAGRVGTGWSLAQGAALRAQLEGLAMDKPLFTAEDIQRSHWTRRPGGDEHWVRPEMVVEVAFAEWTPDGHIRHAAFQGVREDKPAEEIGMETAMSPDEMVGGSRRRSGSKTAANCSGQAPTKTAARPAGASRSSKSAAKPTRPSTAPSTPKARPSSHSQLRITHPDRVIDEASGATKIQLVRYYESVSEWLLPHLAQRPLALVRAPEGVGGQLFFQKHVDGDDLIVVRDMAQVLEFTQLNTVEFHTWNSRADKLDKPDRIVFDLDPGEGVSFAQVREGAQLVRALLEELQLKAWLKTSGGKGLHVVVPLTRRADHDTCKSFSHAVVDHLAATLPKRFSAKSGPRNRVGKIFVDYLRNGEGQTTAAAFSVRARPGMGVSMPVDWDQLAELKGGDHWTLKDARDHLSFVKQDPWQDYWTCRQTITAGLRMLQAQG